MPHVSLVKNTHNFFYNKAITTKKKRMDAAALFGFAKKN